MQFDTCSVILFYFLLRVSGAPNSNVPESLHCTMIPPSNKVNNCLNVVNLSSPFFVKWQIEVALMEELLSIHQTGKRKIIDTTVSKG